MKGRGIAAVSLLGLFLLGGCRLRLLDVHLSEERIEELIDECSLVNTIIYNQDDKESDLFKPTKACEEEIIALIPDFDRTSFEVDELGQEAYRRLLRGLHTLFFFPLYLPEDGRIFESEVDQIPERYYTFLPFAIEGAPSLELDVNHLNRQALLFFLRRVNRIVYRGNESSAAMKYRGDIWRIQIFDGFARKKITRGDITSILVHEATHWDDRSNGDKKSDHDPCIKGYKHDCDDRIEGAYGANVIIRNALARAPYYVHLPPELEIQGWMGRSEVTANVNSACSTLRIRINQMPDGIEWEDLEDCDPVVGKWIEEIQKNAPCNQNGSCPQ